MPRATVCSLMKRSVSRLRSRSASGRLRRAHVVAGHGEQERIEEEQVGVRHLLEDVVAEPEGKVEPVEALRGQHGEIVRPHLAVVEPGLVERLAGELPHHAAHRGWRAVPTIGLSMLSAASARGAEAHAVGQFEQRVDQPARVGAEASMF